MHQSDIGHDDMMSTMSTKDYSVHKYILPSYNTASSLRRLDDHGDHGMRGCGDATQEGGRVILIVPSYLLTCITVFLPL